MKTLLEAAQQALEALESGDWYIDQLERIVYCPDDAGAHEERARVQSAITALRAALAAAPQAEPVAWRWLSSDGLEWLFVERKEWAPDIKGVEVEPLYTAPQPAPDDKLHDAARMALEALNAADAESVTKREFEGRVMAARDALQDRLQGVDVTGYNHVPLKTAFKVKATYKLIGKKPPRQKGS